LAIAGFLALWLISDRSVLSAVLAAIAMAGAGAVALLVPRQPVAAVGVCFALSVFSRVYLVLPAGSLRLEQPALIVMILAVIWYRSRLELPPIRQLWPLAATALIYLGALALSSAFVADQPIESLKLVAWSALSMAGGAAAALLVAGHARRLLPWFSGSAVVVAAVGFLGAVLYLLFALGDPLVGGTGSGLPKVYALVYEPNLYASLMAAVIPLALEMFRERPRWRNAAIASLLLIALGLGVTRGAYIGLVAGLVVYFGVLIWRAGVDSVLKRVALIVVAAGLIGLVMPVVFLNPQTAGILLPQTSGQPGPGGGGGGASGDELETLEYRLQQVAAGLEDFRESPIIGMGAYSYGQRHLEPTPKQAPAVIAIWPLSVLHDAGVVGLAALSAFFALLGVRVWRATRDAQLLGPAAAFGAAVVVLLVAYLATTALHFAVTWLIIGGALGATLRARPSAAAPVPADDVAIDAGQPSRV